MGPRSLSSIPTRVTSLSQTSGNFIIPCVSAETRQRRVFEDCFNVANPDLWLRDFHQNFCRWLNTSCTTNREMVVMELAIAKLPNWLEPQIRNLNCQSFKELSEAIVRHLVKLRMMKEKDYPRKEDRKEYKKEQP